MILKHPKVKLVANALGTPPADVIEEIQASGRLVGALCGSVKHALAHKAAGVDFVIAQGGEGGGHTGDIGSIVLWPQVIDAVAPLPVLAAGGIGDGRQMAAALVLGAAGRLDRLALAHGRGGRDAAGAEGVAARGHQPGHRALALVDRQALPHAAQRLDRGLGEAREPEAARHAAPVHGHGRRRDRARTATPPRRRRWRSTRSGQVVGLMNEVRPVREVIVTLVEEYLEAVERFQQLQG